MHCLKGQRHVVSDLRQWPGAQKLGLFSPGLSGKSELGSCAFKSTHVRCHPMACVWGGGWGGGAELLLYHVGHFWEKRQAQSGCQAPLGSLLDALFSLDHMILKGRAEWVSTPWVQGLLQRSGPCCPVCGLSLWKTHFPQKVPLEPMP